MITTAVKVISLNAEIVYRPHPHIPTNIDTATMCVRMKITGHATFALLYAHDVIKKIMGENTRWRFADIQYIPADDNEYASASILSIEACEISV